MIRALTTEGCWGEAQTSQRPAICDIVELL
jgi:hypothetical protein